jgi:sporulation-control protein
VKRKTISNHSPFKVNTNDLKHRPKKLVLKTHVYLVSSIDNYDEDEIKVVYR